MAMQCPGNISRRISKVLSCSKIAVICQCSPLESDVRSPGYLSGHWAAPTDQCSVTPGRGHTMTPSCSLLLLLAASWLDQATSFVIDQEQLTALLQQYLSLRWPHV